MDRPKSSKNIADMKSPMMDRSYGMLWKQSLNTLNITINILVVCICLAWGRYTHIGQPNSRDEVHEIFEKLTFPSVFIPPQPYQCNRQVNHTNYLPVVCTELPSSWCSPVMRGRANPTWELSFLHIAPNSLQHIFAKNC